jgi:hypothetical protein
MTQFKVGDEVQLVKDTQLFKRRKKGVVREILNGLLRVEYGTNAGSWVPVEYIRPYTKRIRPSKCDITKLKQEIAIRNDAIDRLENDVRILHSEKVRLGETNAWLTEQNDALKKEVIAGHEIHDEMHTEAVVKSQRILHLEWELRRANEKLDIREDVQAQTALSLYIWKAVAVVAVVADLVLGAILIWG